MTIVMIVFFVGLVLCAGSFVYVVDEHESATRILPNGYRLITDGKGNYAWKGDGNVSAIFKDKISAVNSAIYHAKRPSQFPDDTFTEVKP